VSFTEADRDRYLTAFSAVPVADNPLPENVLEAIRAVLDEAVDHPPIPALLPRDWPRQVAELCERLGASGYAEDEATRLVDGWVLAAADASAEEAR
jgi:hypothetical protein